MPRIPLAPAERDALVRYLMAVLYLINMVCIPNLAVDFYWWWMIQFWDFFALGQSPRAVVTHAVAGGED